MHDFIEDIYKYAEIIPGIKEIQFFAHKEDEMDIIEEWAKLSIRITDFCKELKNGGNPLGDKLYSQIFSITQAFNQTKSFTKLADGLEEILPMFYEALSCFNGIDVTEGDYRLFSTRSGYLSLEKLSTQKVYHSVIDPMWEAHDAAFSLFKPDYTSYAMLGCGLGYLPYQLFQMSDSSADIYIFHASEELVSYALDFGVLSLIPPEKLHIFCDSNVIDLLSAFTNLPHDSEHIKTHFCLDFLIY